MPKPEEEIAWLEFYTKPIGGGKVFGIGLNHENMTREQVEATVTEYEAKYRMPTADPLWHGCEKFVERIKGML